MSSKLQLYMWSPQSVAAPSGERERRLKVTALYKSTYRTFTINGNSSGCETTDQSASRLIDDVMTSTNENSGNEVRIVEVNCDNSFENILRDEVTFSDGYRYPADSNINGDPRWL